MVLEQMKVVVPKLNGVVRNEREHNGVTLALEG